MPMESVFRQRRRRRCWTSGKCGNLPRPRSRRLAEIAEIRRSRRLSAGNAEAAVLQQLLQRRNALLVPALLAAVESQLGLGPFSGVKEDRVLIVVPPKPVELRTARHQPGRW